MGPGMGGTDWVFPVAVLLSPSRPWNKGLEQNSYVTSSRFSFLPPSFPLSLPLSLPPSSFPFFSSPLFGSWSQSSFYTRHSGHRIKSHCLQEWFCNCIFKPYARILRWLMAPQFHLAILESSVNTQALLELSGFCVCVTAPCMKRSELKKKH